MEQQKEKLKDAISTAEVDGKIPIIITHHIPSYTLIHDMYKEGNLKYYNQCYASECDSLIKPLVGCWIYGHTHTPDERKINDIPCLVNPIGYIHEMENPDFNKIYEL
jgi:predicted phosphodiesterase